MSGRSGDGVRLTDLLSTLSLAVDLGLGQPMGHVGRSCVIATRLAEVTGVDRSRRADLVHVARLGWLGCIADSRDAAATFGDDIDYRAGVYDLDMSPLPFLGYLLQRAGSTDGPTTRAGKRAGVVLGGARAVQDSLRGHCQVTAGVARRFGLGEEVCTALDHVFARWDGKGLPAGCRREGVPEVIRIWQVADVAAVHHRRGGVEAATAVLRSRTGTQLDPRLVAAFCEHAAWLLAGSEADADWEFAADLAPHTYRPLTPDELDHALAVTGDWVDLKSPWFSGHSRGVAALADAATRDLGLPEESQTLVRRAGHLHDLGRTGVSNLVWDKPGPLSATEQERVRLHSYYTERVLLARPALAAEGRVAAMAHERLDGSGYHRGLRADALPVEARVLAAADAFHTKLEPRPHRPALQPQEARAHLLGEVDAGRLDRRACDAVLAAAGQPRTALPGPAGLTDREAEVLTHLARGLNNRQIGRELSISPKTVGNHVEHLYAKAGVSTRAAATLFAMEHGLAARLPRDT